MTMPTNMDWLREDWQDLLVLTEDWMNSSEYREDFEMDTSKYTPYVQTFSAFWLACLDPEWHKRTCNYWYTIDAGAQSHVAFTTKEELLQWLSERGLKLTDTLPEERGTRKSVRIEGTYKRASYMDVEAFKAIVPLLKVAEMSNAQYTLGKVTEDEQGVRTVHHLNPNVKERIEFPYWTIENREEGYQQLINESPDTL